MADVFTANGHVQAHILAYLAQVGIATSKQIAHMLDRRCGADQESANAALCRMNRLGYVRRVRRGVYELGTEGQYHAGAPTFLVQAVLDRLFTEYEGFVTAELRKRGWWRSK